MATITWLGEDDQYEGGNGPRKIDWNGVRFEIGKALDLKDIEKTLGPDKTKAAHMLAKAKTNRFFKVEGADDDDDNEPEAQSAPDPFDHDGDGKPGGSKPKRGRRPAAR